MKKVTGTVDIEIYELDMVHFSNFEDIAKYLQSNEYVTQDVIVTNISFYHEFGMNDEPDISRIIIDWEAKGE